MCSSIVREGCREAVQHPGGRGDRECLAAVVVGWSLFSPLSPMQLASPAERRLVGCRRQTVEARLETPPSRNPTAVAMPV